jgi:hypothetical protein
MLVVLSSLVRRRLSQTETRDAWDAPACFCRATPHGPVNFYVWEASVNEVMKTKGTITPTTLFMSNTAIKKMFLRCLAILLVGIQN